MKMWVRKKCNLIFFDVLFHYFIHNVLVIKLLNTLASMKIYFCSQPLLLQELEEEVWYHEGSPELKVARLWIAKYSLPRSEVDKLKVYIL